MVDNELQSLITGINDEWVSIESLKYDGIFNAELVIGQLLHLPLEPICRLRQKLNEANIWSILKSDFVSKELPLYLQKLSVVVVEETNVS